jgi:hypothetical protein
MIINKSYSKIFYLLLALLFFSFLGVATYQYVKSLPHRIVSFEGITLGQSKDEVQLMLGVPNQVLFPPQKTNLILEDKSIIHDAKISTVASKKEIEANPEKEKWFDYWEYKKLGYSLFVEFDQATKKLNLISCYNFNPSIIDPKVCTINKIHFGRSEEQIIDILGNPDSIDNLGLTKILNYPKLNMVISLDKDAVFNIQVKNYF